MNGSRTRSARDEGRARARSVFPARARATFSPVRSFALVLSLALGACAPPAGPSSARSAGVTWTGRVTYEARHETERGASEALETRPARFVDLALLDAAGALVAEGRTDEHGRFAIVGPRSAARLVVYARTRVRGHDAAISTDPLGARTHRLEVPLGDPDVPIVAHAADSAGQAGAFHVVDTMLRGLDAVRAWTGRTLPPVYAYWVRGGTREWSYYRGERPEGSGRFALELLGGDPGQQSISDTDEHDEAIILHELGHFVMDRLAGNSSSGGMHPRGARIDPGLAWEEGRATWFAVAVLGRPIYRDTIGVEPWGRLRVDFDVERGDDPVTGIGSEASVAKILWDLSDGADGVPDEDEDGVALGPAAVLEAMIELSAQEGSFPCLASYLAHLARARAARDALAAMLQRTGEPVEELLADELPWPRALAVGEGASGKIDGLSQPAPSGGPNLPAVGFDAVHTYRVHVPEAGMLVVRLEIVGSGSPDDRADLDLELLDLRAERITDSRTYAPIETVGHFVQPGWYIVRVRDGGTGNRADYRVHARIEPFGASPVGP